MIIKKATDHPEISKVLHKCKSIDLSGLNEVSLLNRIDNKYLFNISKLPELLNLLSDKYFILEIDNMRIHPYKTLYFDTADYKLFHLHHNGIKNRYKFRTREYSLSGHIFNEVKVKTNKGKTLKSRILRSKFKTDIDNKFSELIINNTNQSPADLQPSIYVNFNRITFCDYNFSERLTIDLGLNFKDCNTDNSVNFSNLIILEVKQSKLSAKSTINEILKKLRIFPMGNSKYCLGVYHLKNSIKRNNFKSKNRIINKILSN